MLNWTAPKKRPATTGNISSVSKATLPRRRLVSQRQRAASAGDGVDRITGHLRGGDKAQLRAKNPQQQHKRDDRQRQRVTDQPAVRPPAGLRLTFLDRFPAEQAAQPAG